MEASSLLISLDYDLTSSPKTFVLNDDSVYSGETLTNVLGNLRAIDPTGNQFHNNTSYVSPDIDYNANPFSAAFPLPLDTDGNVKLGIYTFTYTAKLLNDQQNRLILSNDSAAKTFVILGNYASQILDPTTTAFKCIDTVTTNLTIVSAAYSSVTGNTTVTVGETLGVLSGLATFQYTVDVVLQKTFTQNYTYGSPSVCLNWESSNTCSSMTITDVTAYPSDANVTRLHTVHYPDGMVTPIADITSPLQELTISPIWTGTWTDTFTADLTATVGIINITDQVRGVKEFLVSADAGVCQIYTCLTNITNKFANSLTQAPEKSQELAGFLNKALGYLACYNTGKQCGKPGFETWLTKIATIADQCGCGCDCGDCADGTPVQVVGVCGNVAGSDFTIVLQDPTTSITISSVTVGTTTTFTIGVSEAFVTALADQQIGLASINDLADVNTSNISPVTNQVLMWDNATQRWVRGTPQLDLIQLADVDDTGLADTMILYYDAGTQTFKFKLLPVPSVEDLSDVLFTGLVANQTWIYNGTKWVNINYTYQALKDVNTSGLANGVSFKWDSGTAKFIIYTPKLTFASLNDVTITSLADNDRVQNNTGAGWVNVAMPSFSAIGWSFGAGYTSTVAGFYIAGYAYDPLTGKSTIRGTISNANGAVAGPVLLLTLPVGQRPANTVPFHCTVGIGSTNSIAFGDIGTNGQMNIYTYLDPSNPSTGSLSGIPAGAIAFTELIEYYINI